MHDMKMHDMENDRIYHPWKMVEKTHPENAQHENAQQENDRIYHPWKMVENTHPENAQHENAQHENALHGKCTTWKLIEFTIPGKW